MAHLKEQSLGRVLVCLLHVRSEGSIFNDFFCKSTSQCREFSASPVKGLNKPLSSRKVFNLVKAKVTSQKTEETHRNHTKTSC